MDTVFIDRLRVFGILGIHPHEQETPQEIRISVRASTDISRAAENDEILDSVNYSTLAKEIIRFIDNNHYLTIEALIEALAAKILENERVEKVWLRVEKPTAVPNTNSVGVEISRSRSD
jgi:FolB domain-containing protein